MEIVIKIPEEDYIKISNSNPSYADDFNLYYAIKNGTPLPKGHGRLKDVDILESHDEYDGQRFTKSIYKDDIDNLPTIIEADGGGKE